MDGGDEGDGVLVEEQVFNYLELRDLCDAHPQETSYEHYPHHCAVVLDDDENTDHTDDYGEGFDDDDIIVIDTKYCCEE